MAALGAGFALRRVDEYSPDTEFVRRYPRAERYLGWPMLVVLALRAGGGTGKRPAESRESARE